MPEDNERSGGVDTGSGEVEVGGDIVGRDKFEIDKEPTGPNIIGVIGIVGLILVSAIIVLALVLVLRDQNFGSTSGQQLAETRSAAAILRESTPIISAVPTIERKEFHIESMPLRAFAYSGESDPAVGKGRGWLSIVYDKASVPGYRLDYTLPDDGYGYAGLAFKFSESQNLSGYKFVEVTLKLEDKHIRCELALKDLSAKADYVPIGAGVSLVKGATVAADGDQLVFKISLETGFNIAREAVAEMGVSCDTEFSRGNHSFTISEVKFLLP
jgi:hypothetical protein